MNTTGLNSAILSTFGETMTITVSTVETEVTAVFAKEFDSANVVDMVYQQPTPMIHLLTSDFEATSADERDTITRNSDSVIYTIVSIQKDEGGMTMLGVNKNA